MAFGLTLWLRWDSFFGRAASESLEASYHVLWTMRALTESPPSTHWWLPTVTIHPVAGNDVTWGATRPNGSGSFIYTSFPPLGFLVPLAVLSLLQAPLTLPALAIFNSVVGLLAACVYGLLMRDVDGYATRPDDSASNPSDALRGVVVFAGTAVGYLFLRESLHSHGAVYWAHSPSQLVFSLACWLAFRQFIGRAGRREGRFLLVLCALYPLLEWTGYVFNVGLALTFIARAAGSSRWTGGGPAIRRARARDLVAGLPIQIALITMGVGVGTLGYLIAALGWKVTAAALGSRALARVAGPTWLVSGAPLAYWRSFGPLLPLGLAAIALGWQRGLWKARPALGLLLGVAAFPMIENSLMLEHAMVFSFDRLKFAVPLGVAVTACVGAYGGRRRATWFGIAVTATIVMNVWLFRSQQAAVVRWVAMDRANQRLAADVRAARVPSCAVYGATGTVRGYVNLLFDRDVYEWRTLPQLNTTLGARSACGFVLIGMEPGLNADLPRLTSIEVYDREQRLIHRYLQTTPAAVP